MCVYAFCVCTAGTGVMLVLADCVCTAGTGVMLVLADCVCTAGTGEMLVLSDCVCTAGTGVMLVLADCVCTAGTGVTDAHQHTTTERSVADLAPFVLTRSHVQIWTYLFVMLTNSFCEKLRNNFTKICEVHWRIPPTCHLQILMKCGSL
jgi:hypothetical protein